MNQCESCGFIGWHNLNCPFCNRHLFDKVPPDPLNQCESCGAFGWHNSGCPQEDYYQVHNKIGEGEATMNCDYCDKPVKVKGAELCDSCWEVARHLDNLMDLAVTDKGKRRVRLACIYTLQRLREPFYIHETATRIAAEARERELADAYAAIRALVKAADAEQKERNPVQPFIAVVIKHRDVIGRALDASKPLEETCKGRNGIAVRMDPIDGKGTP